MILLAESVESRYMRLAPSNSSVATMEFVTLVYEKTWDDRREIMVYRLQPTGSSILDLRLCTAYRPQHVPINNQTTYVAALTA